MVNNIQNQWDSGLYTLSGILNNWKKIFQNVDLLISHLFKTYIIQ
jgi:hypothetical protein